MLFEKIRYLSSAKVRQKRVKNNPLGTEPWVDLAVDLQGGLNKTLRIRGFEP